MNMLLKCLFTKRFTKIVPKSSRTSTSTGASVVNIIHEMLLTSMFCMEDLMYDDLVKNYMERKLGIFSQVI